MYGLLIGASTLISILIAEKIINRRNIPISRNEFWNLIPTIFIVSLVGGRVYHILDNLDYYLINPINIFYLWSGGFGIFGALIFVLLFLYIYCKKFNKNIFIYVDLLSFFTPLIQIAGRIGNIFNNELAYSYVEIIFAIIFLFFLIKYFNKINFGKGYVTALFLIVYSVTRIITEYFRNPLYSFLIMDINLTYVVSLFMLSLGFGIMLKIKQFEH